MDNIFNASWIKAARFRHDAAIDFVKVFNCAEVKKAVLEVTARGLYKCLINGMEITDRVLTPGFTDYYHRLQYQTYDVTDFIQKHNKIEIKAGRGNYFHCWYDTESSIIKPDEPAVIAALKVTFENGDEENIYTDATWKVKEDIIRYNHIYNGETVDFTYKNSSLRPVKVIPYTKDILIPDEGEKIAEQERFEGKKLIITPNGEQVIDFGQEITGYVELKVKGVCGDKITIKHFEMPDKDGNVYTENYRGAKSEFTVICDGKEHIIKPAFTFYGFRYICISGIKITSPEDFTAVTVHSDMKRTGYFRCSDEMINQLFHNIIWGQKGNFLDIPTDCPQRDERLGWTGDAQVFCKTASYNFNTEKFFTKWLGDLRTTQNADGKIPHFVPCKNTEGGGSAAWADIATVLPWQMYLTYGHKKILEDNFDLMKNWVEYMIKKAAKENPSDDFNGNPDIYLHNDGWHFGDWLALDLPDKEACGGATDDDLIGTAFFAYSVSILIKAGHVLGIDVSRYEEIYPKIRTAFIKEYINEDGTLTSNTQTAAVLALHFDLTDNREGTAKQLTDLLRKDGHLTTGFVGTPYLMHVLSDIGETKLAYDLLLRKEFPSWCYSVTMGATTMWERWNGLKPDGTFATPAMNSFNHYAYGAVGDWMYEHIAGINMREGTKAFEDIIFAPETDERLTFAEASIETVNGKLHSCWIRTENSYEFTFIVPENTKAEAHIKGKKYALHTGINKIMVTIL